jgi:hypothetical protein
VTCQFEARQLGDSWLVGITGIVFPVALLFKYRLLCVLTVCK